MKRSHTEVHDLISSKDTESEVMPSQESIVALGSCNEFLVKTGVLVYGSESLLLSSQGAHVTFKKTCDPL